jgi:hypothetical protein
MPAKRKTSPPKFELRQQTLAPFLSSSPSRPAPKNAPAITVSTGNKNSSKLKRSKIRKRRDPSPDESDGETSDVAGIQFEPEVIDLTDDDELASPRISRAKKRKTRLVETDSDSNAAADETKEEDIGVPVRWKGRRNGKIQRVKDSDSDEPPRKRKLVKGERPPTPEGSDDIEDEVDEAGQPFTFFLCYLGQRFRLDIIETRLRTRDKKTAFQKNLERLRRTVLSLSCAL